MRRWKQSLLYDIRYGARSLWNARGLSLIAALSLALGIGANSAIFTLVDSILFRPRAVSQPDELVERYKGSSGTGRNPVAIIGHSLWQRRFGADPAVLGSVVALNGQPFTIIGVLQPEFNGMTSGWASEVWVPIMATALVDPQLGQNLMNRGSSWLTMVGRLNPGVTLAEARARFALITKEMQLEQPHEWMRANGDQVSERFVQVVPERETRVHPAMRPVALAGAAGVVLSLWALDALVAVMPALPGGIRLAINLTIDWRVIAFAFVFAVATGVLFGLGPALQASRTGVSSMMKEDAAATTGRFAKSRLRSSLVVGQVAFSLLLLIGAGLVLRSLDRTQPTRLGFASDSMVVAMLSLDAGCSAS